jgi:hypothetical protein
MYQELKPHTHSSILASRKRTDLWSQDELNAAVRTWRKI